MSAGERAGAPLAPLVPLARVVLLARVVPLAPVVAVVASFDEAVGLGTLDAAWACFPFHCTAIADGSRRIEVGARVLATIAPAHLGRLEAALLVPFGPGDVPATGERDPPRGG